MTKKKVRQVQENLRSLGWPLKVDGELGPRTKDAVRDFQRGLYQVKVAGQWRRRRLRVNGRPGLRTQASLRRAESSGGHISEHFLFRDWKSRGNGWIKANRSLVAGLEKYRRKLGRPVAVVSGYRDPAYNASVGGASQSQHLDGDAADLQPVVSLSWVKDLGCFNGIGVQKQSGLVRHVDVGHSDGTTRNPVVWFYS